MSSPAKLVITGTGRCGTTFLIRILTILKFRTGFDAAWMETCTNRISKSGLEIKAGHLQGYDVIKSPHFYNQMGNLLKLKVKFQVLLPLRDLQAAAESRVRLGPKATGGLWEATTLEEQIAHYEQVLSTLREDCSKYEIDLISMEFDRMVTDPVYCYETLNRWELFASKNVPYDDFLSAYQRAAGASICRRS